MKKLLSTIVLAITCVAALAQKSKVWDEVITGYSNIPVINITKVTFTSDSTEVCMRLSFRAGKQFGFTSGTHLKVGTQQYAVKNATVIKLNEGYTMPTDTVDFSLIFNPAPLNTKRMDLIEPSGLTFSNIHVAGETPDGIIDTYWRNDATGDWLIGFAGNHVIYNNKVWDIATLTNNKDAYTIALTNGPTIKVGKIKKGKRTIAIDQQKGIICSPVTTAAMPDYPTKDMRKGFVDNGYRAGDSVTIVGWLKDMPEQAWKQSREFEAIIHHIIIDDQERYATKLDSLGRFTLRFPLVNSSATFLDLGRSSVELALEPGKTYFFLNDFKTGQMLLMGDDARLQNELVACPEGWDYPRINQGEDAMQFKARTDGICEAMKTKMRGNIAKRPNLSQRYIDYINGLCLAGQGESMMQARFDVPGRELPKEYMDYVTTQLWQKMPKPYTLYMPFSTFMRDYLDQVAVKRHAVKIDRYTITLPEGAYPIILRRAKADGRVSITDNEIAVVERYAEAWRKEYAAQAQNQKIDSLNIDVTNSDFSKQDFVKQYFAIMERPDVKLVIEEESALTDVYYQLDAVESTNPDPVLADLATARKLYWMLNSFRKSLPPTALNYAQQEIKLPAALDIVKATNDKYVALEHQDLANAASLRPSTDVENMTDGEKMLRKIIEPYKGRVIYLDVWGTWCGPCKQRLKDSWKEKEALKDLDIVYLYLCNRSSDESWKNVIKEYNLAGPNCVHYNLPEEQQSAIERYLNVQGFPTYKIIDKQGNIHDLDWLHADDMEAFKQTMEKFCK